MIILTDYQRWELNQMHRAGGRSVRSNMTVDRPNGQGDWRVHWHTLESFERQGLVVRIGRHYGLTVLGETHANGRKR